MTTQQFTECAIPIRKDVRRVSSLDCPMFICLDALSSVALRERCHFFSFHTYMCCFLWVVLIPARIMDCTDAVALFQSSIPVLVALVHIETAPLAELGGSGQVITYSVPGFWMLRKAIYMSYAPTILVPSEMVTSIIPPAFAAQLMSLRQRRKQLWYPRNLVLF